MNPETLTPSAHSISKLGPPWWVWVAGTILLILLIVTAANYNTPDVTMTSLPVLDE